MVFSPSVLLSLCAIGLPEVTVVGQCPCPAFSRTFYTFFCGKIRLQFSSFFSISFQGSPLLTAVCSCPFFLFVSGPLPAIPYLSPSIRPVVDWLRLSFPPRLEQLLTRRRSTAKRPLESLAFSFLSPGPGPPFPIGGLLLQPRFSLFSFSFLFRRVSDACLLSCVTIFLGNSGGAQFFLPP